MLPETPAPGSPEDWLRYAHSDLELARVTPSSGILLEGLCFHAQQTAEKSLKALLLALDISFPRTHSIRRLLDLLPSTLDIPEEIQNTASLTDYAVITRYPGDLEPVEQNEYQQAVHLAEIVLSWTEKMIKTIHSNTANQEPAQAREETFAGEESC